MNTLSMARRSSPAHRAYVLCVLSTAALVHVVVSSGYVSQPTLPCLIGAARYDVIDIICNVSDRDRTCKNPQITWSKDNIEIIDSEHFGIWTTERGVNTEHVTLLRIRRLDIIDMGGYNCLITCNNSVVRHVRQAHVCILHPGSNLISCNQKSKNDFCQRVFQDGNCDSECNHPSGLYDGYDCQPKTDTCSPLYIEYCSRNHGNGDCDKGCDFHACGFDGGDCHPVYSMITPRESVLIVVVELNKVDFREKCRVLSRKLTVALRTALHPLDERLNDSRSDVGTRVYDWTEDLQAVYYYVNSNSRSTARSVMFFKLGKCEKPGTCFKDVSNAARFLQTKLDKGWSLDVPVYAIGVLTSLDECSQQEMTISNNNSQTHDSVLKTNNKKHQPIDYGVYIGASLGGLAFVILAVGIIYICKCHGAKQSRDQLDAPEGSEEPAVFDERHIPSDTQDATPALLSNNDAPESLTPESIHVENAGPMSNSVC